MRLNIVSVAGTGGEGRTGREKRPAGPHVSSAAKLICIPAGAGYDQLVIQELRGKTGLRPRRLRPGHGLTLLVPVRKQVV